MKMQKNEHLVNGIDPYAFTEDMVDGVSVYSRNIPWSTGVFVRFIFNVGAMHDPKGKEGLAHFLEHMIFSGNNTYPDKFAIDQFSKKYTLDSLNASTSFGNTIIKFRCLPEHLDQALHGVIEMITGSFLKDEDVKKEKSIITEEAWGVFKNEKSIAYLKMEKENVYHDFPDRLRIHSSLGWPETILCIERDDLVSLYETAYVRENLSVVMSGLVTEKEKQTLARYIPKIKNGIKVPDMFVPKEVHPPKENVWVHTYEDMGITPSKQAHVGLGSIREHAYSVDKAGIFGVTKLLVNELLHRELRHNNSWCYSVNSSFGNKADMSFAGIYTSVNPDNVVESVQILESIIRAIISGKHKEDFEQEKQLMIDRRKAVELVTLDVVDWAVDALMSRESIETRESYLQHIYSVTYEDVVACLKGFFTESHQWMISVAVPNEEYKKQIYSTLKKQSDMLFKNSM